MAQHFDSDYQVRKAILAAIGGDATKHYHSVYDIDIAILEAVEGGGGGEGMTWEQIKNKLETSGVTSINFTNGSEGAILDYDTLKSLIEGGGGVDWDTIKSKLAEDGVESIKFKGTEKYTALTYLGKTAEEAVSFHTGYNLTLNTRVVLNTLLRPEVGKTVSLMDYNGSQYGDKYNLQVSFRNGNTNIAYNWPRLSGSYDTHNKDFSALPTGEEVPVRIERLNDYVIFNGTAAGVYSQTLVYSDEIIIAPNYYFNSTYAKYTSISIYEGDELVRHFIPVRSKEGQVGFVDDVTGAFTPVNFSLVGDDNGEIEISSGEETLDYATLKQILENTGEIITVTEGETLTQELYDALRGDSTNKQVCMVPTRVSAFAAFGICSGALCYAVGQGKDFGATQLTYEFRATTSKIGSAITFDYIYDDLPIELVEGSTFTQDLYDQLQNNPTHRPILLKGTGMLPCIGIFAGGAVAGVTDLSTANGLLTTITYTISSGNVGAAISFTRSQVVDDTKVSPDNTWSSTKINSIVGDINTALETIIGG